MMLIDQMYTRFNHTIVATYPTDGTKVSLDRGTLGVVTFDTGSSDVLMFRLVEDLSGRWHLYFATDGVGSYADAHSDDYGATWTVGS